MIWDEKNKNWNFNNIEIRKWINNKYSFKTISDTSFQIKDISPEIIKSDIIEPEEMNYWELNDFILKLKKNYQIRYIF